jgi:hypothetical protein
MTRDAIFGNCRHLFGGGGIDDAERVIAFIGDQ